MTSEALTVVRAFGDAFAAADFARISETLAPDIVWFGTRGGLDEQRILRGPEAVLEYLREIRDPWKRLDVEAERLIGAGETVVVFLRETAQARHAELEVHNDTAMIFKVRQQKIVEATGYLDRDEALTAARPTH